MSFSFTEFDSFAVAAPALGLVGFFFTMMPFSRLFFFFGNRGAVDGFNLLEAASLVRVAVSDEALPAPAPMLLPTPIGGFSGNALRAATALHRSV